MSLETFFNPRSVAIVGASSKQGKVGHEILAHMLKAGYSGRIFPVNNKADQIEGLKCFPDLASIGQIPDLVIIVVPAKAVADVFLSDEYVGMGMAATTIETDGGVKTTSFGPPGLSAGRLLRGVVASIAIPRLFPAVDREKRETARAEVDGPTE